MTQNAQRLTNIYVQLDMSDREEIRKFIENFESQPYNEKLITKKNLETKNYSLGPVSSAKCLYCGK